MYSFGSQRMMQECDMPGSFLFESQHRGQSKDYTAVFCNAKEPIAANALAGDLVMYK